MSDETKTLKEKLVTVFEEFNSFDDQYKVLSDENRDYCRLINELQKKQNSCLDKAKQHKYKLAQFKDQYAKLRKENPDEPDLKRLKTRIDERNEQIREIQDTLPKPGGFYLNFVLGSINVNLLDRKQRFDYKEQYERFKLWVTSVLLITSFVNIFLQIRVLDSILHFMLVWYHCTLTLRESILVANGSRIKGWWRLIHFLTSITTGILVVWPDGPSYEKFRYQFLTYICYTSFLQFLQYYYQYGCLYRLRALGERYSMDITIQGFHSWMWKGLSFLLPFLFIGYCLQFYIFYTLYNMFMYDPECVEWHVPVVSFMYLSISIGNLFTTFLVVYQKLKNMNPMQPIRQMTRKISRAVLPDYNKEQ